MKKLFFGLLLALFAGCGEKHSVAVEAELPAVGTQEITVVYTTAEGNRGVKTLPAINGKFEFEVECSDSTTIELFTANKQLLAAFTAKVGEQLKMEAAGDSIVIDGRRVIREFVAEASGGELPEFPELELYVGNDSVEVFRPEGIWFFSASQQDRTPAFMDSIKSYKAEKVRDIFIGCDRYYWRNSILNDASVKWKRALMMDAPLRLEGILTFTPCLVEVDTAGTVVRVQRL